MSVNQTRTESDIAAVENHSPVWVFPQSADPEHVLHLQKKWELPRSVAEVLWHRLSRQSIPLNDESIEDYLYPHFRDLHDPYLFTDMATAAERLARAVQAREPVAVYGDYDVDGTSATALLVEALRTLGTPVEWRIPNRETDGYGLSSRGVELLRECPGKLIVVLDCGVTSVDEIAALNAEGREVIVADHHEPGPELPDALAVIDAKRPDGGYPFTGLAAVAVAFKLVQALGDVLGVPPAKLVLPALDLVALGTAADIVPILDENRILMRIGLKRMQERPRPGLRALMNVAGLSGKKLQTSSIVFGLAPRINAAGRLGSADIAVELFLTGDSGRAMRIAQQLNRANRQRQGMDQRVLVSARKQAEEQIAAGAKALVLADPDWHPGVIGIVAARLVEEFYLPTVMISQMEPVSRGSARSVDGFDLCEALDACTDTLVSHGGHVKAAGMSVLPDSIGVFRERFQEVASDRLTEQALRKRIFVDAEVCLEDVTPSFLHTIGRLGPFGPDNMRPVFVSRNVYAASTPQILKGEHLKVLVEQDGFVREVMAFRQADAMPCFAGPVDIAYIIEENTWGGTSRLQLNAKAIRPAQ